MPSRADIYVLAKKLLLAAGVKTVYRGFFYPERELAPGTLFPVAGVAEQQAETITPGATNWHKFSGELLIQLWLNTGDVFGTQGDTAWGQMDELHDNVVQSFGGYFAGDRGGVASQTTVFKPKSCDFLYWYQNLPFIGADFKVDYEMNFA